jgi:hypothetical protein
MLHQITTPNTIFALSILSLSACQIENKMHSLNTPSFSGECDMESPPAVSDELKPVAVCQSSTNLLAPLRDSATFSGEESYDPNGFEIIDYTWNLVEQPSGSTVSYSDRSVNGYEFTPDLAGDYTVELVVTNDRCIQSDPCQVQLKAVPNENLWIELSWEFPGDDMDLHLLQNGATFESDGDCYYGNCVTEYGTMLDWGRVGTSDDPRLDLDDIEGRGPENINIGEPSDGSYKVVVHDYPGSEYHGSNTLYVRIHLDGEMVFDESVTVVGEDSITEIATIEWPSLTVQSLIP